MKIFDFFKKKDLIVSSFDNALERNVLFKEEYDTLVRACKDYEEVIKNEETGDKNHLLVAKATYALSKLHFAKRLRVDMINTISTVAYLPRLTNTQLEDYFYERLGNEILDLNTKDGVFLPYVKILDICGIKNKVINVNQDFTYCYNKEMLMKKLAEKKIEKEDNIKIKKLI